MEITTKVVKRENGTFKIIATGISDMGRVYTATAKQNPEDRFDYEKGRTLATSRVLLKQLNVIFESKFKRQEMLDRLARKNFKEIRAIGQKIENLEEQIAQYEG